MPKITYPNGKTINFMWLKGKYGYIRRKRKVCRYPLPQQNKT